MENKLIFSTKGLYGKGLLILWIILYFCCFPIFYIDSAISYLITIAYILVISIPVNKEQCMRKSYIELYDNHIEGKTLSNG